VAVEAVAEVAVAVAVAVAQEKAALPTQDIKSKSRYHTSDTQDNPAFFYAAEDTQLSLQRLHQQYIYPVAYTSFKLYS
jgi:hypothetical protein